MAKELESKPSPKDIEKYISNMDNRIEKLKIEYNLFFSGELKLPPEKERESLERSVRELLYAGEKSAKIRLLIQNLSSKFSLYNNMWLKRLSEIESGVFQIRRKGRPNQTPLKKKSEIVSVSLNDEGSFEQLYKSYEKMADTKSADVVSKQKVVDMVKTKLITSNLVEANVQLSMENGELNIKIEET